jgi:hypothetical protein
MIKIFKISTIIILVLLIQPSVFSQVKIQIVTRTISKNFEYKPGSFININAEKANIQITKSRDNSIHLKLLLISKNPSRDVAESDLKYCEYKIAESNKGISISNFFNTKTRFKEITSNLSAKFDIEVPAGITLILKNLYGEVEMNSIDGNLNLAVDYGKIKFSEISGSLNISSNFTDITGSNTVAPLTIMAQKADIVLNNIKSLLKINDQYGNIELENPKAEIAIDAEMTAIKVLSESFKKYSFDIISYKGNIDSPDEYNRGHLNYSDKEVLVTDGNLAMRIRTSYSKVTLKLK